MQTRAWEAYNSHTAVVNDFKGTVKYEYTIYDQFNQPLLVEDKDIIWNVENGSIESAIFTKNENTGTFSITAGLSGYSNISATTSLKVLSPLAVGIIEDEVDTEGQIIKVQYYDLTGKEVSPLTQGAFIRKVIYDNGKIKTQKSVF